MSASGPGVPARWWVAAGAAAVGTALTLYGTGVLDAAASFLTPVATPANLMVMGPGGYRFGDYWRLGLPLLAMFVLVGTFLVPLVWSF